MSTYNKILAAVDLTDEADEVVSAALEVAESQGAELHVMTTIRPLSYSYSGFEPMAVSPAWANFEPQAKASAQQWLKKLCEPFAIPETKIHVSFGRPADEIKREAEALAVDLIVVGSHSRKGLGLLLGSTATGVLHGAKTDVLTVRISADN